MSFAAEWLAWGTWGPCSKTCDYGIRQRTRGCSVSNACSGIGLSTDTEYCTQSDCPNAAPSRSFGVFVESKFSSLISLLLGTLMIPYKVPASAKADLLSSLVSTVSIAGSSTSAKIRCTMECLSLRPTRHSFTSCNGFIYEDDSCKLVYKDPNWVAEQGGLGGPDDPVVYFDFATGP